MQKAIVFRALILSVFSLNFIIVADAQSTITFYANISDTESESGWVGHVWVGLKDGAGAERVVGFYPGGLRDDSGRTADINYSFPIQSTAPAGNVLEEYSAKGYFLGLRDCRAFASDVAAAVGLRVPAGRGARSPAEWMAELVELNF